MRVPAERDHQFGRVARGVPARWLGELLGIVLVVRPTTAPPPPPTAPGFHRTAGRPAPPPGQGRCRRTRPPDRRPAARAVRRRGAGAQSRRGALLLPPDGTHTVVCTGTPPRHPITRLRHLLSDRTDVVYADSPILGYAARQNPRVEVSAENDITPVAVGTPKGDGTLPAVAAALEHIVTTPEYRKVLDNYGLDSMAVADARVNVEQ